MPRARAQARECHRPSSFFLPNGFLTTYKLKQMLILPIAFLEDGGFGIRGVGGITDSCGCIDCCGDSMPWNMCSRHSLACGTGSRTSRIILFDFTRSRMSREGSLANISHLEDARSSPRTRRFDSSSRTIIPWRSLFEERQYTLSTVSRPDRQFSVIGSVCKLRNRLVHPRNC